MFIQNISSYNLASKGRLFQKGFATSELPGLVYCKDHNPGYVLLSYTQMLHVREKIDLHVP